jgi:hypothetical protein
MHGQLDGMKPTKQLKCDTSVLPRRLEDLWNVLLVRIVADNRVGRVQSGPLTYQRRQFTTSVASQLFRYRRHGEKNSLKVECSKVVRSI